MGVLGGGDVKQTLTRVIQQEPSITKVTRVIEGQPSITKVTRVIESDPTITKVTRVVSGPQYSVSTGTSHVAVDGSNLAEISTIETGTNFDGDRLVKMIKEGVSRVKPSRRVLAGSRRRGRD
ncbi:uncharacterized protein LOC144051731 [Vanacampus margaritifer]